MQIDLCADHPYKDWKILSQEEVKDASSHKYKITFAKDQGLLCRIAKIILSVLAIIVTFGLILFSQKFQSWFYASFKKREIKEVFSSTSLEDCLWKRIKDAPSAHKLYFEALGEQKDYNNKNIEFEFLPETTKYFPEGSEGAANFESGKILLKLGRTENSLLGTVVFELTNFKQQKRFRVVDQEASEGKFTEEEYAKECERIEYDGVRIHQKVIDEAIVSHNWHKDMNYYDPLLKKHWRTFEEYWKDVKETPHVKYYKKAFQKIALARSVSASNFA